MQNPKRTTRLISFLLSCIMVLQMIPFQVFAAEDVTSGICGGGVTWHLDGDILYIEGEGEMYDFLSQWDTDDNPEDKITLPPWIGKSVTKIVVGEGVTYIGNKAFYEMSDVVEAVLPSTLKGIGYYAFSYMSKLEIVNLPEGLETMDHSAFSACAALENITIPSTLKVIPYNAFWQCTSLTDLTISYGVEEIGEGAFDGCSGIGAEGDGANDLSTMFDGPGLQRVEIPGSVKTIGGGAFASCTMLREVVLHEGIERIGGGAFNNCNSLYDVTLPASLKSMGEWVFTHMGGSLDYKLEEQGIPVTRLQNVYILSRELSLKATEDYDTDMAWFDERNTFTMFHVYEDSVAASELEQYNLKEYHSSYIPDCGHELEAFVSDDENTHTRTCTEDGCTASQTVRHTLTVDLDNLTMGDCETALRYRMRCTACDYVGEFITKEAAGHEISGYYHNYDEDYHEGYCWKCSQYVLKPHEWEYDEDPTATEPYEVEAYCADCGTTKVITALPAEATIISVKAKDENGDDATLPEDAFTVRWEDSEGNLLAEGTTYVHEQIWLVTEDTPVFAVVSFSDEVREAYSTGSEYRHKVTVLGERTEFVLVPRETLTVTGRVMVDGYTYPPVDWLSLTLTTEIAGNETVLTVTPDSHGYFTTEIRRASTRLDYAALGYERVVLENVQMMPAVDGVIDVGTLTLVNQMAWYYPTVESSDYAAVAAELAGASLIAVNERTGEEYNGAKIERHSDNSLAISFGMDMDKYFKIGDRVTIRCAQMDEVIFDPYTFTITKQDEQVPLDINVYKAPKLEITLNRHGHVFLFDSEDNLVFDSLGKTCSSFLPRDTYTLVAIEQNYRVPTIDAPDALEQMGIPSEYYLKETIDLTEDVTLECELPYFYYGGELAIAASFDTAMQTDGLVPMYLNFNHIFKEAYAEGETIEFTFSASGINSLPVESIGGTYAFGEDGLGLTERIVTDRTDSLVVTTTQPRGTILLYVKPTGESLRIRAKTSSGTQDYLTLYLPEETSIRMIDPTPSGWTTNADHFVTLYTKLPEDYAPYTGYLYVNGEPESEQELKITGEGRNYLHYTLERYEDGASTHDFYVEIVDKDGELVWTSENYMVTLTNSTIYNTVPQELTIRTDWQAGDNDSQIILKKIDLQKNPGASFSVPVNEKKINADGTLMVDAVFDYALRMSDNSVAIKDNTVYMKVFCGEDDPVPIIHDVKLRYNGETGTYDGSLTLEAGTYTVRDLPYGYSFDYSMAAGGSSNSVPVGSAYGTSYSVEQLVDEMEDKAANYIAVLESEPYEYYDPDDVEFAIENMEGLTDEEKQMMRTLLSISNDFYRLQQEAQQSSTAAAQEMIGGGTISDSPAEGIQDIMSAFGDDIVCEPTDLTADDLLSNMEYTEIDTSKIGDDLDMVLDSFYLKTDVESLRTSVVDPNNGIEYAVNHSGAVSGDEGGASFKEALKEVAVSFYGGAVGALDVALDATEKVRKYFDNELTKKLGLETSAENFEETIEAWKKSLDEIEGRVHNIEWGDNYQKSILEAQRKTLDDILEIRQTRNAIAEAEQTLKSLRAELISTKLSIENCERVVGSKFLKYSNKLSKFDNIYAKFAFIGVDVLSLVVTIKDATEAFDTCIENYNRLQFAQEQADRMKEALTSACPGGDAYYTQWDKCSEAHRKLMDAIGEAEDWNKNLLYVKYGQVVGELASIAAGFALKGPQGIIVSLGIGIAGGGSEWFALEQFYDALEEVTKLQPEVESACLEASQDPSITDGDCDDDDDDGNGGDEDDGHDGIPGYSNGLGICEEPQYPVKTNPTIDPAGYVYEAVASNRIEGATAKIYYEQNGEEVYWSEAEDYDEVNPQITDMDGRFAWMTPIGNWLVKVEKEGYLPADSRNDPAADADGWLPVPPPQLDVNIAMTSTAAPTVLSAGAASDQIRVVFSQYMDTAQMAGLVAVTQNGQPIPVDILFEDAEVSPTDDTVYYGRILKLTRTDGAAFSGDGIVVTIDAAAKNYAGKSLAETYVSDPMSAMQLVGSLSHSYPNRFVTDIGKPEQIAVQVLDTNGNPMAGVTVTARQKIGGTLEMNESAVSDANGRAVFTVKGLSAGSDVILFAADVVSTEMNTRVSPLGSTAPQKPEANLSDYAVVEEGTQLILTYPGTEDVVIYYTTNNTCPCSDENDRKIYDGPVTITEDTFFRIAAWTEAGGYSERLNLHIAVKVDVEPTTYTVSFAANGGTGSMADVTGISGEYTLPANGFTAPEGKQFKAWSVNGSEKAVGDKITVTADTTLTAVWWTMPIRTITINGITKPVAGEKAKTAGITLDPEGISIREMHWLKAGTSYHMIDDTYEAGKTYPLLIYYTVADGYEIADDVVITHDLPGAVVTMNDQRIRLNYIIAYAITFDANGGTGAMAPVSGIAGEYTLPECTFTAPDGKQFKCWSVGGREKAVGDKITVTADTTLTAVWKDAGIPINAINITGISEPIAGQLPDISGITTDTTGIFLGDIIWCTPEASVMNDRLKFEEGKTYTFCANYTVDEGYELLSGAALTHDLAGGFNAKIVPSMKFIEIKYTVSAAPTYTVSFDAHGGSGTMEDVPVVYGEYTLPECTFTPPAGKQFKAWSVGGSEKAVGDKITVTADTTLTAVWEDAKILINTISVRGITAPVDRAYPVTTGITTDTPGLTITHVQWNRGGYMQTSPFEAGLTYNLSIYFEVAEGYEISDSVTVDHDLPNGVPGRKNLEAESPWISIDYTVPDPAPKTPIGSVRVSDITAPVYGATPDLAITVDVTGAVYDDGDGYDAINWYKYNPEDAGWYLMYEDTSFGAGTYILAVYLKADDGYEFTEGTKFYFGDNPLPEFDDKLESNYKYSSEAYVAIYIYYTVEAPETPATYTVSFDANGGSVTPASAVTGADGKLASLPTPARSGSYSFDGWYTAKSGGTKITTSTVFTADTTVYAHWTYTGGGGGGSYAPVSYAITVVDAKNGDVTADTKSAAKGETVTVTVDPDKGYTLETLTVTDKNGKEIELTNKGDGKYTFKMPASKITVKATFMDDNTMLNFFVDVPADSYYYDAVLWAVKEGITNGTSATTFSPDASCTRAQMVTFLWRAAGSPEPKVTECKFTDVNMDSYYGKAVLWAVENGITNGTSDTTFSPDATCTRAQMAVFLCRMADGKPVSSTNAFTDVKADAYYADSVQWAVENAITNGTGDNKFSPDATCTRAQMVTFLYRYFVK